MAVPLDKGSASRNGGTSDITVSSFTPAADAFMVAQVFNSGGGDPDSLTGHDAGSSWTKIATSRTTANGGTLSLWGAHSGSSPSASTLVVVDSTSGALGVNIAEVPDIDVSGTVANSILDNQGNSGYGTSESTPALSATSDLTMGFFAVKGNQSPTPDSTELQSTSYGYGDANIVNDYNETGDTTHTASTVSSRYWAAIAISFKLASVAAVLEQEGFQFRDDDGSETGATDRGAQDSNITEAKSTNMRLRVLIAATNDPDAGQYQLEWKKSGDSDDEYRAIT